MAILFDLSRIHIRLVLLAIIGSVFFFFYKTIPSEELYDGTNDHGTIDIIYSSALTSIGVKPLNKFSPKSLRAKIMHLFHCLFAFVIIMI